MKTGDGNLQIMGVISKPNSGVCVYTCETDRTGSTAMNPAETPDDPVFTPRSALMLLCGLAVLALAGYLAWRTSAPAAATPTPAPPVETPAIP